MTRFDTISDLTNPELLYKLTGPISKIDMRPLNAVSFSHAELQRIEVILETGMTRSLILKIVKFKADWLSQRTNDPVGREGMLLCEPFLSKVWDIIHCPYIAFAIEDDTTGLLMEDFSAGLFPDIREPISLAAEDIIIDAIASVHAQFWDSPGIRKIAWLTRPTDYLNILRPGDHENVNYSPIPAVLKDNVSEGWRIALELLPAEIRNYIIRPVQEIFEPWKDLPVTLLHGDIKIANMAIVPDGKLVLFDWSMIGCAPCAVELGWYLAINATRLAVKKEELMNKYRSRLESHLQFDIDEETWREMERLAIVTGAVMLLWSKALAWQSGTQRGKEEWEWWLNHLQEAIRHH